MYSNVLQFTKHSELAKDLTQDIFYRIWVKRNQLTTISDFRSYLYAVAKNMVVDELRKRIIPAIYERHLDTLPDADEHMPDRILDIKELSDRIDTIIASLPAQVRTAYQLKRVHGLSHEEIAAQMNISAISSRSYVARAVVAIKAQLAGLSVVCISGGWIAQYVTGRFFF